MEAKYHPPIGRYRHERFHSAEKMSTIVDAAEIPTSPIWYEFRNAVFAENFELADSLLAATPELARMVNGCGETVLQFLAVEDDLGGVAWLYSKGFSIDAVNAFGDPVIFEVAQLGYRELFKWFVHAGVNLAVTNKQGQALDAYLREWECEEMADWVRSLSGAH